MKKHIVSVHERKKPFNVTFLAVPSIFGSGFSVIRLFKALALEKKKPFIFKCDACRASFKSNQDLIHN